MNNYIIIKYPQKDSEHLSDKEQVLFARNLAKVVVNSTSTNLDDIAIFTTNDHEMLRDFITQNITCKKESTTSVSAEEMAIRYLKAMYITTTRTKVKFDNKKFLEDFVLSTKTTDESLINAVKILSKVGEKECEYFIKKYSLPTKFFTYVKLAYNMVYNNYV